MPRIRTSRLVSMWKSQIAKHGDTETALEFIQEAVLGAAGLAPPVRRRPPVMSPERLRLANATEVRYQAEPWLSAVAARHRMTVAQMIADPSAARRFEAMFVLSAVKWGQCDIAIALHLTNHTSVIYGLRKIEKRFVEESGLRADLLEIAWTAGPGRALRSVA